MSEFHIIHPQRPHSGEELMLAGFRVDASHDGPQFYTALVVGSDNERPLVANGRIVFFSRPELAAKSLLLDPSVAHLRMPLESVETLCDVAEALYLVNSQDNDPDGVILDCLLVFDDLVRAAKLHMPERYQSVLTEMAARLTERVPLRKIFSSESLRNHVEDAMLWCVGAITVKATMITE